MFSDGPDFFAAGRIYNERERMTAVSDFLSEDISKGCQIPGLVGLRNLGNTCYLNAILQALLNCPPLTEYILTCRLPVAHRSHCLALSYNKLAKDIWSCERQPPYLVPVDVLQIMRSIYPSFRSYQQQDAQEFLRCFLDSLHEDLKQPVFHWELRHKNAVKRGRVSSEDRSDSDTSSSSTAPATSIAHLVNGGDAASSSSSSTDDDAMAYVTCDSGHSSDSEITKPSHCGMTLRRRLVKSECLNDLTTTDPTVSSRSTEFSEANFKLPVRSEEFLPALPAYGSRTIGRRQKPVRWSPKRVPRHKAARYRSIVSDVFDGQLLSSVQCLTCNTISETRETFQDLSLPIPSLLQLEILKKSRRNQAASSVAANGSNSGWIFWAYEWLRSWVSGPKITLEDCLAAFFSADDLKGDDMYSCDRCKKLRNGVKFCSLLSLPEVLCIHLKRFRHENIYSSKIATFIDFPLEHLNMAPFIHKKAKDEVQTYDLIAVICHRGGVEGGHYTAYCLNSHNSRWYEFDDQYATEVDPHTVKCAEAYVLFYRKSSDKMALLRDEISQSLNSVDNDSPSYYMSREWVHRFNTFAEPGPITNFDFLCPHGWISPWKTEHLQELYCDLPNTAWHSLYDLFGGGPVCSQLRHCTACQMRRTHLIVKRSRELAAFTKLQRKCKFLSSLNPNDHCIYCLSTRWFRQWEDFITEKEEEPPGPIDNTDIIAKHADKFELPRLMTGAHYKQITQDLWQFFVDHYEGGPAVLLPPSSTPLSIYGCMSSVPRTKSLRLAEKQLRISS